ncbi:hypothetical protein LZ24_01466 [Desulfobotulus alkaliphilus]|uniref:Uncharacterized protein n=1 Tax=Desulfobotulus alkaliphilus TaxID=622671 RepID=A0A562RVF1_9BACT|nr:hypothetical protein [Desulfobotulus alkaliphilus]TWI73055.1 hypothetical protein LZ24_01466 [Desulfobotulus alkaliphilus]
MARENELLLSFQLNLVVPQPLSRVRHLAKTSAVESLKEKGIKPEDTVIDVIPANFENMPKAMAKVLPPFFPVGSCTVNVYSKA